TRALHQVWLRRASADLGTSRPRDGEADALRGIAIEPWAPNAWAALATAQLQEGDPRRAAESARHALSLLADLPQALLALAQSTAALGDPHAAQIARNELQALARTPSPDTKTTKEAAFLLAR